MITLMLLSAGSLVGQNLAQALAPRRQSLRLLASNSEAAEPSLTDFDEVRLFPPTAAPEFEPLLEQWLETVRPDLVIPCRDADVLALARLAQRRRDLAPFLLCGSAEVAAALLDKWESAKLCQTHDLPFADTIAANDTALFDAFVERHGFPLLAKPRAGFASNGVRILLEHHHLDTIAGDPDLVVQQYLSDPNAPSNHLDEVARRGLPLFHSFEETKTSLQAMIARDGSTLGTFVTRHRMRRGISVSVEPVRDTAAQVLAERCAEVLSGLGWRGPLNIQCQRDASGELRIYEFNGRFTGATAARALLGFDELGLAVASFCRTPLPALAATTGSRVVRQPSSRLVEDHRVASLQRSAQSQSTVPAD